jgi:hypothetical protein
MLRAALGLTCLVSPVTSIAQEKFALCKPVETMSFPTRVHVRCELPVDGRFVSFAASTDDQQFASRVLHVSLVAQAAEKTLSILFDPNDLSGVKFGCQAEDCRAIRAIALTESPAPKPSATLLPPKHAAVAPLSDGRLALWFTNELGQLFHTRTITPDANADWILAEDFLADVGALPAGEKVKHVAVAPLPNGRLELWATTEQGQVFTTWQTSNEPDADWEPWWNFLAQGNGLPGTIPGGAKVTQVAVAPLSDKSLELWATTETGQVFTTWKTTTAPDADWEPWWNFLAQGNGLPGTIPGRARVTQVAVAPLPDKSLELWATTETGQVFTTWKVTPAANADWEPWWTFLAQGNGLPGTIPGGAKVTQVAVAPLSDKSLELWATTETGQVFTTWKVTPAANADWEPWWNFLAVGSGLPGTLPDRAIDIAVAAHSDKRLKLWVVTASGQLLSTWKVTTASDADWVPWVDFMAEIR